jgi:hypothetical protein
MEHLFAVNPNRRGCGNTQSNLLALDLEHRHADVVTDTNTFANSPSEYQHRRPSMTSMFLREYCIGPGSNTT